MNGPLTMNLAFLAAGEQFRLSSSTYMRIGTFLNCAESSPEVGFGYQESGTAIVELRPWRQSRLMWGKSHKPGLRSVISPPSGWRGTMTSLIL